MDKISPEEILVEGSGNKLTVESSETDKANGHQRGNQKTTC